MQLSSAKGITEGSSPAPSVMTPCGISSAVPSLHPLEVTTNEDASFTRSKSKNCAYPTFHTDIYTLTLLHLVPFMSNWSMKVEKQEDTEVLYVFMRRRLLEPVAVFCVVPANWNKALAKLVVTLFGIHGVQLSSG